MSKSQKLAILDYLEYYNTITSMQAFELFGVTRLSAIIFNLRKEGHMIKSTQKKTKNRYGNTTNYVEYTLVKGE